MPPNDGQEKALLSLLLPLITMMQQISEDDSILSAYLDGELDIESRRLVESRLATNPQLAGSLRRLGEVKGLISALGRPTTPDLSYDVLALIKDLPITAYSKRVAGNRLEVPATLKIWVWAGAIAASALLALLPFFSKPSAKPRSANAKLSLTESPTPKVQLPTTPLGATNDAKVTASISTSAARKDVIEAAAANASSSIAFQRPQTHPDSQKANLASLKREDPHGKVLSLLDQPQSHTVFMIADKISGTASEKVAKLLDQSARSDYYSINVAQGIVIDPEHPGQAKVFAFTIDESELAQFRSRLSETLAGFTVAVTTEPKAELIAQLSEIGDVEAFPPQLGELVIPRSDVALKAKSPELIVATGSLHLADGDLTPPLPLENSSHRSDAGSPAGESSRDEPGRSRDLHDAKESNGPDGHSREIVVLIWITSPPRG